MEGLVFRPAWPSTGVKLFKDAVISQIIFNTTMLLIAKKVHGYISFHKIVIVYGDWRYLQMQRWILKLLKDATGMHALDVAKTRPLKK